MLCLHIEQAELVAYFRCLIFELFRFLRTIQQITVQPFYILDAGYLRSGLFGRPLENSAC
jgi:hypothetical protein